jgi:hypothetical protein
MPDSSTEGKKRVLGLGPEPERLSPGLDLEPEVVRERALRAMQALEALYGRCRRQSLSIFVPMGGEMAYRYQENLMTDLLRALRSNVEAHQPARRMA